jgi:hypothetical protein
LLHVFLLIVMVNNNIESNDMYFLDINRCSYFAEALVKSQAKTGFHPPQADVFAYCVPRKINSSDTSIKLYREMQ